MQLDLFTHSRDVVLRNEAIEAARTHSRDALAGAIAALANECPQDPLLPALEQLLQRISMTSASALSPAQALAVLQATEDCVPLARRLFGGAATAWLAPLWLELAARIAAFSFDPGHEALHPAALLLRAERWDEANAAIEHIPSWRRLPAPLAWKVEAEFRIAGLNSAWPLLAELSWMAPARAAAVAATLQNSDLNALTKQFDADFEGDGEGEDFAWFPAWTLIAAPQWASAVRLAQAGANTPPERAARQMLNLLALERQGQHAKLIESRAALRAISAPLFEHYMRTRR